MATKQTNSNLVSNMSALTLKEVPIAALQVHGSMGRAFTEEEKEFIKKHLDVIQMVNEGEVCTTTGTPKHSEAIFTLANKYRNVLWDKGKEGDAARAQVRSILEHYFPGLSNDIQLFNYDNNWKFLNDVRPINDTATYQIEGMGKSTDSRQLFDKNFDLLEFAKWVATQLARGPNMDLMDVDISEGTPYRMKIIIISCMGKTMGGGRRKKKRQKYTRRKRGGRLQELGKKINELQKKIAILEQDNEYYGNDIQSNANDINIIRTVLDATEGSLKNYIDNNIAKNSSDIGYIWSFINHKLQNYREGRPTALDDWKHHLDAQIDRGEDTRELRNAGFSGGSRTRKKKKKTRKRRRKKTKRRKNK